MSQATAASVPPRSRRIRRGKGPTGTDTRYRHAVARRPRPVYLDDIGDGESAGWPGWLIPSSLIAVMSAISAYHFDALMAALRAIVLV